MADYPEYNGGVSVFSNPGSHESGLNSIKNHPLLCKRTGFLVDKSLILLQFVFYRFQYGIRLNFARTRSTFNVQRADVPPWLGRAGPHRMGVENADPPIMTN
jgi:hypothetical protein